MKRVVAVILVLVVGWFGGAALYRAMASDETKIRWVFEDEAAAFNGMALLVSMEGFASDYRDTTRGITRQQLRRATAGLFQYRRLPDGTFRYRVELPEDDYVATIDGDKAKVDLPLWLFDLADSDTEPAWNVLVHAELEKREGVWYIVRSTHDTMAGDLPK